MKGRIVDFSIGLDGRQRITVSVDGDLRETYNDLREAEIDMSLKKFRQKRSLDANAYCWTIIDKLAAALRLTKAEIYREAIRGIGGVSETVCVKDAAVSRLVEGWEHNGLGWFADTVKSKIPGCTNVVLYYGSSVYDTKQMSALIDALVTEAKAQGIETLTPEQLAAMSAEWR